MEELKIKTNCQAGGYILVFSKNYSLMFKEQTLNHIKGRHSNKGDFLIYELQLPELSKWYY